MPDGAYKLPIRADRNAVLGSMPMIESDCAATANGGFAFQTNAVSCKGHKVSIFAFHRDVRSHPERVCWEITLFDRSGVDPGGSVGMTPNKNETMNTLLSSSISGGQSDSKLT